MNKPKRQKHNYVDNKKFLTEMIAFRESVIKAEKEGKSRPVVPFYIGDCIMKIATHLSYKPNFVNYTFREEMISDGIENCLQYIDNFNPEKSKNPFAYFTQIIYYAFLRRIQKEKRYLYTKYKATENANIFGGTSDVQENDIMSHYDDGIKHNEWSQEYMSDFIENFEANKRRKKKTTRPTLDKFINEDNNEDSTGY
jgi:DNA-directed RNA polymerase specialized sigma24 family protein